jgi:hypothetical protein
MVDTKAILKKAELFEKLSLYGDRRSFLQALAQDSVWVDPIESLEDPYDNPAPKKQVKLLRDGDRINPEVQKALVRLYPESAPWIKPDGVMGPNTRGALNRYKTDYQESREIADPTFQSDLIRKSYIPSEAR